MKMLNSTLSRLLVAWVGVCSFAQSGLAADADQNFKILGIITSTEKQPGVALIKEVSGGRTFAARVGNEFSKGYVLRAVNRKTVEVFFNNKSYILAVGDETSTAHSAIASQPAPNFGAAGGFEKKGDTVQVSTALRDHIVKDKLGDVLMQAAAVPFLQEGRLAGFTLWDIEPESVFEKIGLKDGDTVTAINGQEIRDVGATIRLLNSLRQEPMAAVSYMRNGSPAEIKVMVQ